MASQGGKKGRNKKKEDPEKPPDLLRWLLTYADMITLLMLLFVVLYAMSKVEQAKFSQLALSLSNAFSFPGIQVQEGSGGHSLNVTNQILASPPGTGLSPKESPRRNPFMEKAQSLLETDIKTGKIRVNTEERGIVLALAADTFFRSGSATLYEGSIELLSRVAELVQDLPNQLVIEGHTDNTPVGPADEYRTNLMLSAARAVSVAEALNLLGIPKERLSATGYGDAKPARPNTTPEGRGFNRRVEILIRFDSES